MNVYETNFLKVNFFQEKNLAEMIWLEGTKDMEDEDYQEEFTKYLALISELKPRRVIVDTIEMNFPISVELQEWTNTEIFPKLSEITHNVAFLVSREMIIQMGIEQTMEEEAGLKFHTRYFDEKETATKWLLEQSN